MSWHTGLLDAQRRAASHVGCHACLLAGPGTGKTLTLCRRVVYLVSELGVAPEEILALTFTRAAAHELQQRVAEALEPITKGRPRISTLHSFALRQLLKNAPIITTVPRPLRIADDWEERNIVEEDLKRILEIDLREVRHKFNQLSSDWQTLTAEEAEWETRYPDPPFLGGWRKHRDTYGYMLRSELVYQLKKALEQIPGFTLEQAYKHILVDEYQDLNRCDLAVVKALSAAQGETFGTGGDDQSIYGFRFAHPEGIRRFEQDYSPCKLLNLEYCIRCDRKILDLGEFVANLDYKRIPKPLKPIPDAGEGQVKVLWFKDQHEEADAIARLCKYLIAVKGYEPAHILLLLRNDRHAAFSDPLRAALEAESVPVACRANELSPFDELDGRELLGVLHLCVNSADHLAWRTLLQIRDNNVGEKTIGAVYDLAANEGLIFAAALRRVEDSPDVIPRLGNQLSAEVKKLRTAIGEFSAHAAGAEGLIDTLSGVADKVIPGEERRAEVLAHLREITESSGATTLEELLSGLSVSLGDKEQEIDHEKVNILTMHKAKGLTANAVFIVGAEDEYIPGKQLGGEEGDARRLLYVSLTRARHDLFLTYCKQRTGRQMRTGRTVGQARRTLSRFLVDAPIRPEPGADFVSSL